MSGAMIRHFYHAYADGSWHEPLAEHCAASAALPGIVTLGIVGAPARRAEVRAAWTRPVACVETDSGFEFLTLAALHAAAIESPGDLFLYAHTKGAYHPNPLNTAFRRSMTSFLVRDWERCAELLSDVDAVGCHWLTPAEYPDEVSSPFFGGNFWWARGEYIARLPPPGGNSRFAAEGWIGLGDPKVKDLRPGWPSWGLFGQEVVQILNPQMEVFHVG